LKTAEAGGYIPAPMTLALTWYQWFKAAHVLAAVLWVGGGSAIVLYALMTLRQNEPAELASLARKVSLIAERFFTPLSFIVLGFGFGLVENGNWGYDRFFVQFSLAGWGASALTGMLFLGPESAKLGKLLPTQPPDDPEIQYRIRRILLIARFDALLLLAVVFVMTAKPFL
jgi:uncharacterized membrane protein